jgi:uncharacterized membrane protein YphA (DoxX/SURF4 family)
MTTLTPAFRATWTPRALGALLIVGLFMRAAAFVLSGPGAWSLDGLRKGA